MHLIPESLESAIFNLPVPPSPVKMSAFLTPPLPQAAPRRRGRPYIICKASTPNSASRITRRALLLSLLPLPALSFQDFPDIDPNTATRQEERAELSDSLLHSRQQRYGITDQYTHATHEDYLNALHIDNPPHALRTFLARSSVVAFVAAFSAFGMAVSERESMRSPLPAIYDREAVDRYFRVRPDKVIMRMALFAREISGFGIRWAGDAVQEWVDTLAVRSRVKETAWAKERHDTRDNRRARLLREAITRLGTAVIKLGQAAASRQDLFGVGVIRELQKLQDDILDFFPTVEAFMVIEDELGASPMKLFEDISLMPVAGASLGMVFKGRVDDTVVAVKVQRPEVAENVALDCYIVRCMAAAATRILGSRTDLADAVDEYASRLFEELDYLNELENMNKFRQLYGDVERIYLPKAFPEYCSRKVLVTEWVDGVKLIDNEARVRPEDIGLVKTGIRFALAQLLDKGFLHADMHSGNMLRTKSGYLAFIDFGLVSYVPVPVRESLVCALMQLIHGEYTQLAQSFSGLALMNTDDLEVDLPLLSEALRSALEPTNSSTDFTLIGIVGKLLSLGTRFRFVFNDYFLNNLRCLGMLEGLALAADPEFSILQVMYPYVAEKLLTERSPRFRKTLSNLVIDSYGRMRWNRMERLVMDTSTKPTNDALLRYITSPKGRFLRDYLTEEYASIVSTSCKRRIDELLSRPIDAVTKREESDVESRIRTRKLFRGSGAGQLLVAMRLLPGFIPALIGAVVGVVKHAAKGIMERVRGEDRARERVVVGQWRAFDSAFLRKCRG